MSFNFHKGHCDVKIVLNDNSDEKLVESENLENRDYSPYSNLKEGIVSTQREFNGYFNKNKSWGDPSGSLSIFPENSSSSSKSLSDLREAYHLSQLSPLDNKRQHNVKKNMHLKLKEFSENYLSKSTELVHMVEKQTIGGNSILHGPFGARKVLYLDNTASGKALKCIEDYIQNEVLPSYANTHTVSSYTGIQTTHFREEAREIISKSVHASPDDAVLFVGSGTTGCIHKLVHHVMHNNESGKPPIIFIGPYEHHSNLIPWRETGAEIVNIGENKYGQIDISSLKEALKKYRSKKESRGRKFIGCFSAASNVTGTVSDDVALTILMHKFGGFAFFDYAAAAPHIEINMNPEANELGNLVKKDAIYFSGHKFIGGPQTTGVLVVKRNILENPTPHGAGGGTVFFVVQKKHAFLGDLIEREEGGTGAIVENIRLGLVMKLKKEIGVENIVAREAYFAKKAISAWSKTPNIQILGSLTNPRIPIISFLIKHSQSGYYLHHNFISTLLNDLFGIQSRSGCMCAGPYSQTLLGISEKLAKKYEDILSRESLQSKVENQVFDGVFKPGMTRVAFSYHSQEEEVDFVIEAIKFTASYGWKFLPYYECDLLTGSYKHLYPSNIVKSKSLTNVNFTIDGIKIHQNKKEEISFKNLPNFEECLNIALREVPQETNAGYFRVKNDLSLLRPEAEPLRWFLLASEAVEFLVNPKCRIRSQKPFSPHKISYVVRKNYEKKVFRLSIPHQLLNTVWLNDEHELTKNIFESESRLKFFLENKGAKASSRREVEKDESDFSESDSIESLLDVSDSGYKSLSSLRLSKSNSDDNFDY